MYVVSLFIIIFAGYREYNEVNNKYKKLRQDSKVSKLQTLLVDVIDIQTFLEEEADRAASNILRSDDLLIFKVWSKPLEKAKLH